MGDRTMRIWKALPVAVAAGMVMIGPTTAQARPSGEIVGPVLKQHSSITKMRKTLRGREKKGQSLTGAEYYALAFSCGYEEPKGPSKIMNFLSQSKCTDQIAEYYVQAGMHGTPEGFLAAGKAIGTGDKAYMYGQAAYQLAGNDSELRSDALEFLSEIRDGVSSPAQANQQATALAASLVSNRRYASSSSAAPDSVVAAGAKPKLTWLDFKNPKRCEWGPLAFKPFVNSVRATGKNGAWRAYPTRIPGISKPAGIRIIRNERVQNEPFEYDFEGRWNGLNVVGLRQGSMQGYPFKYSGTAIRFSDPVSVVVRRLASLGFPVKPDGSLYLVEKPRRERYSGPDGSGVATVVDTLATWVVRRGKETYFFCDQNDEWQ
ncbi:MAG: hypothetical protein ACR2PC_09135 [Tsuneonella suprasediminis]